MHGSARAASCRCRCRSGSMTAPSAHRSSGRLGPRSCPWSRIQSVRPVSMQATIFRPRDSLLGSVRLTAPAYCESAAGAADCAHREPESSGQIVRPKIAAPGTRARLNMLCRLSFWTRGFPRRIRLEVSFCLGSGGLACDSSLFGHMFTTEQLWYRFGTILGACERKRLAGRRTKRSSRASRERWRRHAWRGPPGMKLNCSPLRKARGGSDRDLQPRALSRRRDVIRVRWDFGCRRSVWDWCKG